MPFVAKYTFPPAANVPDPEGRLQTTPITVELFLKISAVSPWRPDLVTLVLDRRERPVTSASIPGGKPVAALAALPPAAKAALPRDTIPEGDSVTMPPPW